MKRPFEIVKEFEDAVAEYTGAPFVVAVNSCTNALFLCLKSAYADQIKRDPFGCSYIGAVEIPKLTYISVPMQIIHAGFKVKFRDEDWQGIYRLNVDGWDSYLYDAARRFTLNMWSDEFNDISQSLYNPKVYMCTSHHWNKILGIQQGGCILHNDGDTDAWFREARFDGRVENVKIKDQVAQDDVTTLGYHMYMSPEIAAEGLVRLSHLSRINPDMPRDDYPDLSNLSIFK